MLNDIKNDANTRMQKCVDVLKAELTKLRTGRDSAALLDHIRVDYYGPEVPLSQAAQVTVDDARTIQIQAWANALVAVIGQAIMIPDHGLTPNTAGHNTHPNTTP